MCMREGRQLEVRVVQGGREERPPRLGPQLPVGKLLLTASSTHTFSDVGSATVA